MINYVKKHPEESKIIIDIEDSNHEHERAIQDKRHFKDMKLLEKYRKSNIIEHEWDDDDWKTKVRNYCTNWF